MSHWNKHYHHHFLAHTISFSVLFMTLSLYQKERITLNEFTTKAEQKMDKSKRTTVGWMRACVHACVQIGVYEIANTRACHVDIQR